MSQIVAKMMLGRKVKEEKIFTRSRIEFSALYEAAHWLNSNGYSEGILHSPNPIPFTLGLYSLPSRWVDLSREDKKKLAGVILSDDFTYGNVKVILFED